MSGRRTGLTSAEKSQLYALVSQAFDAKGTPAFKAAIGAIVEWQERRPLEAQIWYREGRRT